MQCVLCSGENFADVYQDERLTVVRCKNCSLVQQVNCAENIAKLNQAFENIEEYYQNRGMHQNRKIGFNQRKLMVTADIRHEIKQRLEPPAKILDVGCGSGEFAGALAKMGFDVLGIEPDPLLATHVKATTEVDAYTGMYSADFFAFNSFNCITFIQVVEHLENPLAVLSTAQLHLKPGGLLIIDVPSFHNPRIYTYRLLRWKKIVKKDFIAPHCFYYTRHTLSQIVEKAGFRITKINTGRYSIKSGKNNLAMTLLDKFTNLTGIGGITLYATKPQ